MAITWKTLVAAGGAVLLATAGLMACRRTVAPAVPIEIDIVESPKALVCRIDASRVLGDVHRGLFGTNLEWFNQANGVALPSGQLNDALVGLARDQGVTMVRFPGGTLSDFYNWRDGTGPQAQRPMRDHPTDPGRSPNIFGTPELASLCTRIGADPLITVNAGTGTADDAAAWVEYCNAPQNAQRSADGLPGPLNVKWWEVGNELYLPGNPGDKKIIAVTPEVYAARFLEFAAAMRGKDPSIRLMAIGTANPTRIPLPYPDWTKTLLEKAAGQIDAIAIHPAYFPYLAGEKNPPVKDVYQTLWAAPEAVDRKLKELSSLLAAYEKQRVIGIAITEWGMLFSIEPEWVDHIKTLGSAVYVARLMQVFLANPRVEIANYFKFTDRSCMGWVSYEGVPKVPYYVVQLFARHFGTRMVAASIDSSPTFQSRTLGATLGESDVPEVTVAASVDESGRKVFVNLVNRSWDTAFPVSLEFSGLKVKGDGVAWSISSSGVTDHNGRDLPPDFPVSWQEPSLSARARPPVVIAQRAVSMRDPVVVPPFSVVTIEAEVQS